MSEIRTRDKRDKLRLIFAKCTEANRLQPSLMALLQLCDDAIGGSGTPGTFLSSTSEAHNHVAFEALKGFTPIDAKRMAGELLDLFDSIVKGLGKDPNDPATYTDAQAYAGMMAALVAVRRFRLDHTGLRYGVGLNLG
ncbi:MAG: hypothetical protein JWR19_2170 [Pedosphaera sp.]|nr:hypothetical protein [Pedosphaera sp.]